MKQPDSILRLMHKFTALPGVGSKMAARYTYSIIGMSKAEAEDFCSAIMQVKERIGFCTKCYNLSESEVCPICENRDNSLICVVAYPKDVLAIEKTGFNGVYHVLHGTYSPLDGRGPNDIRIKELIARMAGVNEVIMATNPDIDGEATAMYIARLLKPMGIRVSRIAQGISMGSDIEYTDEATLVRAINQRTDL